MTVNYKKWPGITVSESDRKIMSRIQDEEGVLRSIQAKDLLMIAASIAVKSNAPELAQIKTEPKKSDIMSPGNLQKQESLEYRQYIALIYYLTKGEKNLNNMSDTSMMVSNFIDYAQRGLRIIESNYLNSKDGSDKLMEDLAILLAKK